MELSDIEIVKLCIQGKYEAYETIIARYKNLVFSVLNNMIEDKQDISDYAQEVFIKMYSVIHKYDSTYKFSTWVVKITTNFCIDQMRKKKPEILALDKIHGIPCESDTPEASMIKKEKQERIQKALFSLPEKYRIPLVLFHQNGLSYEELEKILNKPMSIIKNRLYRARLMLREELFSDLKEGIL